MSCSVSRKSISASKRNLTSCVTGWRDGSISELCREFIAKHVVYCSSHSWTFSFHMQEVFFICVLVAKSTKGGFSLSHLVAMFIQIIRSRRSLDEYWKMFSIATYCSHQFIRFWRVYFRPKFSKMSYFVNLQIAGQPIYVVFTPKLVTFVQNPSFYSV